MELDMLPETIAKLLTKEQKEILKLSFRTGVKFSEHKMFQNDIDVLRKLNLIFVTHLKVYSTELGNTLEEFLT